MNKIDPGYHTLEAVNEKPFTEDIPTKRNRMHSSEQLLRPSITQRKDGIIITSPGQSMCGSVRYRRDLDSDGNAIDPILKARVSKSSRNY